MKYSFQFADTCFFRDGTAFEMGHSNFVEGHFPPHPGTLTGALRYNLALSRGWNGKGLWPEELNAVLGNGPDDCGMLKVRGPFLYSKSKGLKNLMFRVPRHVAGEQFKGEWKPKRLLGLGAPIQSDLGSEIILPESVGAELECSSSHWVSLDQLLLILECKIPEGAFLSDQDFFDQERRVGIEIDPVTGTAKEHQLYSISHVRPALHTGLYFEVEGSPSDWTLKGSRMNLGGEGRFGFCDVWDAPALPQKNISLNKGEKFCLIALAPALMQPHKIEGLKAKFLGAFCDRHARFGGWYGAEKRPLVQRSGLAAGSVLVCEAEENINMSWLFESGKFTHKGFGLFALGKYPNR